mmetsp:Transcript_25406/g.64458  ORF Transcript_25406/g.64458 Transcript_25406/m.64458 type:complete len:241 (+) Transcript_25406:925-1647(+)
MVTVGLVALVEAEWGQKFPHLWQGLVPGHPHEPPLPQVAVQRGEKRPGRRGACGRPGECRRGFEPADACVVGNNPHEQDLREKVRGILAVQDARLARTTPLLLLHVRGANDSVNLAHAALSRRMPLPAVTLLRRRAEHLEQPAAEGGCRADVVVLGGGLKVPLPVQALHDQGIVLVNSPHRVNLAQRRPRGLDVPNPARVALMGRPVRQRRKLPHDLGVPPDLRDFVKDLPVPQPVPSLV